MTLKIIRVLINGIVQYHIIRREDNSLVDVELDYGRAWVRMLIYENIDK